MTGPCPRPECSGATHTDGWGNPTQCPREQTEPTRLTREELQPLATALYRREAAMKHMAAAGLPPNPHILPPLPNCPTCAQPPTELSTQDDQPITDRLLIAFRACGHLFAANGEDVYETALTARQQAEQPLPDTADWCLATHEREPHDAHGDCPGWAPDDGTQADAPATATPLEEAQATVESLRYQIRRAREALATDEPPARCPNCGHIGMEAP